MSKLTPREKKELSYERDRRNTYGQNAKASRKAIPRRKRWRNRTYRHAVSLEIKKLILKADPELAEEVQSKVAATKRKTWRKRRDQPLGAIVKDALKRRREREAA